MMYTIVLVVHIATGGTALLAGLPAMFSKKGSLLHTRSGLVFYYSMLVVAFSALAMTILKPNGFLLAIALFTLHLTQSGRVSIALWKNTAARPIHWNDTLPHWLAIGVAAYMIGKPLYTMISNNKLFVPVLAVFGVFMLFNAIRSLLVLYKAGEVSARDKRFLLHHIQYMGGAYIATFTAFSVVNIQIEQWWIVWLAPTMIGTYFISRASHTWAIKLKLRTAEL